MGKNNTIIKQWLSDEKRMASLVNGCLFSGKQIFKKEDLLCPVITIIFYYGEEEWDGKRDLHGLLGLDREEYQIFKEYVPNYRLNLINPAEIEDLSGLEESLQMVFGMLRYRKDSSALKNYIDQNRKYFSSVDEETYRAAKMMLGADSHWKDIRSEDGEMNMCKALEDLRQEGIDAGVELGTLHFIEAFQEIGKTYEETKKKLQEKFNLTEEDAEQKMKRCWK